MFICWQCQEQTQPRERATRIVAEVRDKIYPRREGAQHIRVNRKDHVYADPGGVGREIVKEVLVCRACAIN